MAYKLVVADVVKVPVKFTLNDAGKVKKFDFSITCERLEAKVIRDRIQGGDALVSDFMRSVMKGWEGQSLVVDEEGKPADYNDDSRDVMLDTAGVASIFYAAYISECGAKEKN